MHIEDMPFEHKIYTPGAQREPTEARRTNKKALNRIRNDPNLSKRPELPLIGPTKGGKLSGTSNTIT